MRFKTAILAIIFTWFLVGGIGHFIAPEFFLKIVPPSLPFRLEAVYISGFFEVLGALGLLLPHYRRIAGLGLCALTVAVTPANIYMWKNSHLFPTLPEPLLAARLALQVLLLVAIGWATLPEQKRTT